MLEDAELSEYLKPGTASQGWFDGQGVKDNEVEQSLQGELVKGSMLERAYCFFVLRSGFCSG